MKPEKSLIVICDGNSDDVLRFSQLAAWWGNHLGKKKYPNTDFLRVKFGWRGQDAIPDQDLEEEYKLRYTKLVETLKELRTHYETIIFLGVSASAHVAVLLLLEGIVDYGIAFCGLLEGELPQGNNSKLIPIGLQQLENTLNTSQTDPKKSLPNTRRTLKIVIPASDDKIPLWQIERISLPASRVYLVNMIWHLQSVTVGLLHFITNWELVPPQDSH